MKKKTTKNWKEEKLPQLKERHLPYKTPNICSLVAAAQYISCISKSLALQKSAPAFTVFTNTAC